MVLVVSACSQGCAHFPEFLQNFSERQILWRMCSVVFLALTLKLPIQTSPSVAPELPVSLRSGEKCPNFSKTSTLQGLPTCDQYPWCHSSVTGHMEPPSAELKETGSLDATESQAWISNLNVKAWKTTKHKLHKIWRSIKFCKISRKRTHPWQNCLSRNKTRMLCGIDMINVKGNEWRWGCNVYLYRLHTRTWSCEGLTSIPQQIHWIKLKHLLLRLCTTCR